MRVRPRHGQAPALRAHFARKSTQGGAPGQAHPGVWSDGQNNNWFRLVGDYTARRLTFPSDRLPALTGIAAVVPLPAADYLAGLWLGLLDVDAGDGAPETRVQ